MKVTSNISIENANIKFRNFSGKAGQYNAQGMRNFCVFLEEDLAKTLLADGWNVRYLQPKDDQEDEQPYLQVSVGFDILPPKIIIMTGRGKSILDEESVSLLDWAEIGEVDLIIRPYNWGPINGKSGVKAYVKSMYVILAEDEFEHKYRDIPDSAVEAVGGCGNCEACDGGCSHDDK